MVRRPKRTFTAEEIDELRRIYAIADATGKPVDLRDFCNRSNRHRTHVCRKARQLGLNSRPKWGSGKAWEAAARIKAAEADARKRERLRKTEARRKKAEAEAAWKSSPLGSLLEAVRIEENKRRGGKASRDRWMRLSEEEKRAVLDKQKRTMMARYGRGNLNRPDQMHTRGVGGIREDLGIYMRSTWEANWARYLNLGIAQGSVKAWEYEPTTFTFPDGADPNVRSYTPDFRVCMPDGSTVYHEVKGWMTDRSRRALELMRQFHPEVVVQVFSRRAYQQLTQRWRDSIPEWEHCPAATRQRLARERSKRRMRTCKQCGEQIEAANRHVYCSDACSKRAEAIARSKRYRAKTRASRPTHGQCKRCGVSFAIAPMGRVRRFCSNQCGVASYRAVARAVPSGAYG